MVRIMLDDGGIEEAWTPNLDVVKAWGENTIPANWELKDRRDGKGKILVDKDEKRSGGGYRQSKEAFDREAVSRLAWQREEEDRKDRRTALMTAAELLRPMQEKNATGEVSASLGVAVADWMYAWLRSSPAAGPHGGIATKGEAPGAKAQPAGTTSPAGGTSSGGGSAARSDPSPNATLPDTSPAEGEAAGTKPGEGQTKPSPGFTNKASECDHRAGGDWAPTVTIGGQSRCSLCGTPSIKYRETA